MSLFGEALPYEDDTAASLIRRTGYPPEGKYVQMPENYVCPCCKEFSDAQERERLIIAAQQEKDKEKRRLMQLDVFDERAKPLPTNNGNRRKIYRRVDEENTLAQQQPEVPPPPPTLDELRRQKKQEVSPAKLIVTVHYGKNLEAAPKDPMSVIVRCGAFEGQTAKVQRGKGNITTWDELFEFPYPNPNENLEVLVVNDALPETNDHLLGGVVVPSNALHDTNRGDEESLPVYPENEMQTAFDKSKEGPLGSVVVSWYVSEDGKEQLNESALDDQNLKQPLECVFVAHRVFQYTDNGSEPYPGGVLCVLRDTDDNCSDSILYLPGSNMEPSLSPYYGKEGYHYLPENPSQMMQLNTEKKLGHILVCVPKQESAPNQEEEEELFVVGAVPIDFEKLYHKGSAVLLIESKSMDDALWGEISIEWLNRALDSDRKPPIVDVDNESLYVTVVRGLNLTNKEDEPVKEAYVSVAAGEMEGVTVSAPSAVDAEQNNVITWNQEIRFIDVDPKENNLEVVAFENGNPVSTGHVVLEDKDEGTVVVPMHDMNNEDDYRGEIIVNYKRLHVKQGEDATQHSDRDGQREEYEGAEEADHASSGDNNRDLYNDKDEPYGGHDDEQSGNDEADENRSRDLKEAESAHDDAQEDEEEHLHEHEGENDSGVEEDEDDEDHHDHYEKEEAEDRDAADHHEEDEKEEEGKHAEDEDEVQSDHAEGNQHHEEQAHDGEEEEDRDSQKAKEDEEDEYDEYHELYEKEENENKDAGDEDEHNQDRDAAHDGDEDEKDNADRGDEDEYDAYHDHYGDNDGKDNEENEDEDANRGNSAENSDRDHDHDHDHDHANEDEEGDEHDGHEGGEHDSDKDEYHELGDQEEGDHGDDHEGGAHDSDKDEYHELGDQEEGDHGYGHEGGEHDSDKDEYRELGDQEEGDHGDDHEGGAHDSDKDEYHELGDQEEGDHGYGHEGGAHSDHDDEEAAHQEEPAHEEEGDEGHPGDQVGDDHGAEAAEKEDNDVVDDNATDMALGDAKRGKSPSKRPNWSDNRKTPNYKKPWYPSGQPTNESHIPYEKTKRSTNTRESIRNLETRRTRLEEESVRRASTPRSSLSSPHLPQ